MTLAIPLWSDLQWLAHIINSESGNQLRAGKIAVGNVVMNRVRDKRWPNSVSGVILDKNQFTPVWKKGELNPNFFAKEPPASCIEAAQAVLDGAKVVRDDYYYFSVGKPTRYGQDFIKIGGHWFARDKNDKPFVFEKFSASDFAQWAQTKALGQEDPHGYVLGTSGVKLTSDLVSYYYRNYRDWNQSTYLAAANQWLGMDVWDCQGVMDYYMTYVKQMFTEITANDVYQNWCKGYNSRKMEEIPMMEGVAVFHVNVLNHASHIGWLFQEDGKWYVLEAKGLKYGTVWTPWNPKDWNAWGIMSKYFTYELETPAWIRPKLIRFGSKDKELIKKLQLALNAHMFAGLKVDGIFGPKTRKAVITFQKAYKLTVDGIVGTQTWTKMHELKLI